MKRYLLAAIMAALFAMPARADWTGLNATGATITFKNPNACTSVACVPVAQPVDSTGASFGVTGNPFFVSPATGATFPVSASSLPLPTGAATSALQSTINTTLGSPFQVGGSIGNTSFAATQATASSLNATVVGTGTFATQAAQSGTWNINNVSGTVSLPTGASTAAKQPALGTAGSASTDILTVQGIASMTPLLATLSGTNNINNISGTISLPTGAATAALQTTGNTALSTINTTLGSPFQAGGSIGNTSFTVTQATAANLNMTCANCSGSGASGTDEGGFTAGSSVFAPGGGFFQTTATSNPLSTGQWGAWQMTANRAGFVNLRNASGTEIGTASTPVQVSVANTGANGTAMLVTGTGGTFPASQSGVWSVTATQATGTNLHMVCDSGCSGSGGTSSNFGSAFPSAGTAIGLTNGTNMIGWSASSNYGTSPGAIAVPAVNASITNTVPVTLTSTTITGTVAATQSGTWNIGSITTLPALVAGSAIIGKVGIDQTTPGTTNGVQVNAALPAGTNLIGKTGIDQTTVGTTNGVSLAQIGATTVSTGAGAIGAGSARVAVGQDTTTIAGSAPGTAGTPSTNVVSVQGAASMTPVANNQTQYLGTAVVANPCLTGTLTYIPISQATSTQVASLGGSSKKNYVCAIAIVGSDAENISVVEGTGTVCATTPAAIIGGTTAANGINNAANGGITLGNGAAPVAAGSLTSLNNVCILQSGTGRVAGSLVLAQQ